LLGTEGTINLQKTFAEQTMTTAKMPSVVGRLCADGTNFLRKPFGINIGIAHFSRRQAAVLLEDRFEFLPTTVRNLLTGEI
jgi:hypothetical protein